MARKPNRDEITEQLTNLRFADHWTRNHKSDGISSTAPPISEPQRSNHKGGFPHEFPAKSRESTRITSKSRSDGSNKQTKSSKQGEGKQSTKSTGTSATARSSGGPKASERRTCYADKTRNQLLESTDASRRRRALKTREQKPHQNPNVVHPYTPPKSRAKPVKST